MEAFNDMTDYFYPVWAVLDFSYAVKLRSACHLKSIDTIDKKQNGNTTGSCIGLFYY